MSTESSWGTPPEEEDKLIRDELKEAGEHAATRGYFDSSLLAILAALTEEIRMVRCHLTGAEYKQLFSSEDFETEEYEDEPFDETRDIVPSSVPRNLSSEKEIVDFYKAQLKPFMSSTELDGVQIMVEEDQVVLKTPYMREGWQDVSAKLRDLGGEYIREEGNWRWIMLLP